jgi:peptidoglycan/LPS O-acetylase OafA/YrhL
MVATVVALAAPGNPVNHVLYGVVFFAVTSLVLANNNPVARLFSWRPLVAIGVMSYSLYLVHQPLIEIFASVFGANQGTDPRQVFLLLVAVLPVILLLAVLLFVAVERRSMVKPGSAPVSVRALLFPAGTTRLRRSRVAARGIHPPAAMPSTAGAQE